MKHQFLVLHYSGQCPWHLWVAEQARLAAAETGGGAEVIDVSAAPELAARHKLFFPLTTIIDGQTRVPAPTPATALIRIAEAGLSPGPAPPTPPGATAIPDRIVPLTGANIMDACRLCQAPGSEGCGRKSDWAAQATEVGAGILGFIAYRGDEPVAAVEALPVSAVPYPLPERRDGDLFITCIYPAADPDFRPALLEHLITEARRRRHARLLVAAGRRTPFPNGPVALFTVQGFRELASLDQVELSVGSDETVLLGLPL